MAKKDDLTIGRFVKVLVFMSYYLRYIGSSVLYKNMSQKGQSSLTPRSAFEDNLQAFIDGKIPCELITLYGPHRDATFRRWLGDTAGKVRDCLEWLYLNHEILPAPVLLILATTKHRSMTPESEPRHKEARQRRADMKKIDGALKVMATYDAPPMFLTTSGALPDSEDIARQNTANDYLNSLKREIGMIRRRKQPDVEMRSCAQALEVFFREITGKPMDELVGSLLADALRWPRGRGNLRLAALQRAKGDRNPETQCMVNEALILQYQKTDYWLERQKEIERENDQTARIRKRLASKVTPRRKARSHSSSTEIASG